MRFPPNAARVGVIRPRCRTSIPSTAIGFVEPVGHVRYSPLVGLDVFEVVAKPSGHSWFPNRFSDKLYAELGSVDPDEVLTQKDQHGCVEFLVKGRTIKTGRIRA